MIPARPTRPRANARVRAGARRTLGALAVTLGAVLLVAPVAMASPAPSNGPTLGGTSVTVDLPTWTKVIGGETQSFAIDDLGTLWAWGTNDYGGLGDGTVTARPEPVEVTGTVGFEITDVAPAWTHTLALDSTGGVWAWGDNTYGQLGDGTTVASLDPVQISGFGGQPITQIAAGRFRSAAIAADGTIWTWGRNQFGELGNGTTISSSTPVQVPVAPGRLALDIQVGLTHTAVVADDGTVWVWGANGEGQFGNGTTVSSTTPVQVTGLIGRTIVGLSTGAAAHTLALDSTGTVWAWGANGVGQLGDGTTTDRWSPVSLPSISGIGVTDLSASPSHSLALTSAGRVWAWGTNLAGQLGDGTTISRSTPAQIAALVGRTVTQLSAGFGASSVARDSSGLLWGWGAGTDGQFANGVLADAPTPSRALPLTPDVTFGGRAATSLSVAADSASVVAVTPSHPEGSVDIVASSRFYGGAAGPTRTYPGAFRFDAPSVATPATASPSATPIATTGADRSDVSIPATTVSITYSHSANPATGAAGIALIVGGLLTASAPTLFSAVARLGAMLR